MEEKNPQNKLLYLIGEVYTEPESYILMQVLCDLCRKMKAKVRTRLEADEATQGYEELPEDTSTSVRAAILGKGSKRQAEEEADDTGRQE